jgi:hypothetical protein
MHYLEAFVGKGSYSEVGPVLGDDICLWGSPEDSMKTIGKNIRGKMKHERQNCDEESAITVQSCSNALQRYWDQRQNKEEEEHLEIKCCQFHFVELKLARLEQTQ